MNVNKLRYEDGGLELGVGRGSSGRLTRIFWDFQETGLKLPFPPVFFVS